MARLSTAWKFILTFLGFLLIVGITVFIFILLQGSTRDSAYNEFSRLCNRKRTETMQQFMGGITILTALRQQYAYRDALNDTFTNEEWISTNSELVREGDWQISLVSWLTYFGDNTTLTTYAQENNITTRPIVSSSPVFSTSHLIITNSYPNNTAVGIDYLTEPKRYDAVQIARQRRDLTMSMPITSATGAKSVLLFSPYFIGTEFAGGVSGFYRQEAVIVGKNETEGLLYSIDVGGKNFFVDEGFAGSAFISTTPFVIADKTVDFSCATGYSAPFTPFIILLLGVTLSLIIPAIVFYSSRQLRKVQRANDERLMAEQESTNAKIAEQTALQSNALKSAFLANVSHEIRTPLNGITGMTQFLLETDLNEEQANYARVIRQSSGALLSIVNDVLDYSKAESQKMLKEDLVCNVIDIIHNVPLLYTSKVLDNNNEIKIENPGIDELWTVTDPGRLQQILTNLFSNAIKFTKNGIIKIGCKLDERDPMQKKIIFSISDTGIGITKEQIGKLFTPFMQADASTTRKFGGTGLGLSICKRLVDLLGGDIWVESELGTGSTFSFWIPYIPAIRPNSLVEISVLQDKEEARKFAEDKHVLIVDDNKINLRVAEKMLKNIGYKHMTTAGDGLEAVQMVTNLSEDMKFDAVLMDIQMPNMDGYTATREIRKTYPNLPIIAMTANVLSGERQKCIDVGMNEYLTKPLDQKELERIVRTTILSMSVDQ